MNDRKDGRGGARPGARAGTALAWAGLAALLGVMGALMLWGCGLSVPGLGTVLNRCESRTADLLLAERQREEALRRQVLTHELAFDGLEPCDRCGIERFDTAMDVYLLQDLSNSLRDALPNTRRMSLDLIASHEAGALGADVRVGLGSFADKPFPPYGEPGRDYVFKPHQPLSDDLDRFRRTVDGLQVAHGGASVEEAQFEAMIEALDADVGFRPDAAKFMIVITDQPAFTAGAWPDAPAPHDGRGDGVWDDEDYPSADQVSDALDRVGVTPVFLVSDAGVLPFYRDFIARHGAGAAIALSRDSEHLMDTLLSGLRAACEGQRAPERPA